MRLSTLIARLILGPLIRKKEEEDPGSGCLIFIILVIIAIFCAILGIGNYR